MSSPQYIVREFSFEPTQKKSLAFLQQVSIFQVNITSSMSTYNRSYPQSTVNLCTMFFSLRFRDEAHVKAFDDRMEMLIGKRSIPIGELHAN